MELDESHRHELFDSLQAALGPGPARTLMQHLPPVGWSDVATKADLTELERRMDLRFEQVDRRFVEIDRRFEDVDRRLGYLQTGLANVDTRLTDLAVSLRTEMNKQTMALMFGLGSLIVTIGGVIVAALHFSSG
ncbi:MAG TPA: hypothetical protein VM938_06490 [Acidimicrobiales bacterium]|nr:hypothetical protein [Acidimicrobiales bacterium]